MGVIFYVILIILCSGRSTCIPMNEYSNYASHSQYVSDIKHVLNKVFSRIQSLLTVYLKWRGESPQSRAVLQHLHLRGRSHIQVIYGTQLDSVATRPDLWRQYVELSLHYAKSNYFLVFVSQCSSSAVNSSLSRLSRLSSWNPRARFVVVSTAPVPGNMSAKMRSMFHTFWQYRILYVAIMFTQPDNITSVFTYNPYQSRHCSLCMSNQSQTYLTGNTDSLYVDKVVDLHENIVKVSLFPYYPTVVAQGNPRRYRGPDVNMMETLMSHVHATIKIVDPGIFTYGARSVNGTLLGSSGDIAYGRADIAFNSRYIKMDRLDKVEYLYPHDKNDMRILVPNSERIPQYMNLFLPFDLTTWLCVCGSLPVAAVSWYLVACLRRLTSPAEKPTCSFVTLSLHSISSFLSVSLDNMPDILSERLFFIFWVLYSLITTSAFQGSLTSYLAVAKYLPPIDTIGELYQSGLPVLVHPGTSGMWKDVDKEYSTSLLVDRLVYTTEPDVGFAARYRNASVSSSERDEVFMTRNMEYVESNGRSLLHAMTERPSMNYKFFEATMYSPLVPRLESLIQRVNEAGLYNKWYRDTKYEAVLDGELIPENYELDEPQRLTLSHLQTAFYILIIGLVTSGFVLVAERSFHKWSVKGAT